MVEDSRTGEEMKVMLSSVRAPRIAPLGRGARERSVKDEPYAREAKEFVRTRVIGKKVEVNFEYTKTIAGNGEGYTRKSYRIRYHRFNRRGGEETAAI